MVARSKVLERRLKELQERLLVAETQRDNAVGKLWEVAQLPHDARRDFVRKVIAPIQIKKSWDVAKDPATYAQTVQQGLAATDWAKVYGVPDKVQIDPKPGAGAMSASAREMIARDQLLRQFEEQKLKRDMEHARKFFSGLQWGNEK